MAATLPSAQDVYKRQPLLIYFTQIADGSSVNLYGEAASDNSGWVALPGLTLGYWLLGNIMPVSYTHLDVYKRQEEDSDKIGFIADGVTPLRVCENGTVVRRVYSRGTIVIERCLRQEHESGRRCFTISHECAHYIMDRAVPSAAFHREFDNRCV